MSETDSEPEIATDAVSSLTAFARLSATRQSHGTIGWAVDTLTSLDFSLVRKDTALHDLVRDCASTLLVLLDSVLQRADGISELTSILGSSFLHLLFQYRRLFRAIAARDFKPNSAPLIVVCWVDLVLVKLAGVATFVAAGLNDNHPDRLLPESLRFQREEDDLRAAIQLPDNWDILPSLLLSERASLAAKRLSIKLMFGCYILYPALSGRASVDDTIHALLSTFEEFLRQTVVRVDEVRSTGMQYLLQQERLTSALAISLFVAADTAKDSTTNSERMPAFRPQTMTAAMQLLRFVLNKEPTQTVIPSPLDHYDISTNIIVRWNIVPQWAWSIWPDYRGSYADTIIFLTTAYIQHQKANSIASMNVLDPASIDCKPGSQAALISVIIDLIFRFALALSTQGHLTTRMTDVLYESCQWISRWVRQKSFGIQNSMECCKALIVLFGHSSQDGQHIALSSLVVECLSYMNKQCVCDAWEAAIEDSKFGFLEILGRGFIQATTALSHSQDDSNEMYAAQMVQFLVIVMSKGFRPIDTLVEFMKAVWERVVGAPQNNQGFLCEALLVYLASANLSEVDFSFAKAINAIDEETIWYLGMSGGDANVFLAAALSLYIASGPIGVEPLTYLEGLEHMLDVALLACSQHYPCEVEPLALVILPTICDAVTHLLEHGDDTTGLYISTNVRLSALFAMLRSLDSGGDIVCDKFRTLLKRRLCPTGRRLKTERELVLYRQDGLSHLLYM